MENKKNNIILIIVIAILLALIPICFYLGMQFANKENEHSLSNNTAEEEPNITTDDANWLMQLYFDPLVPLFDGIYGDEEKLLITFSIYDQAQIPQKELVTCNEIYDGLDYAIKDQFQDSYLVSLKDEDAFCFKNTKLTKYENINKEAKTHFGEDYNLVKNDVTIQFARFDYIESLASYAELDCGCGGDYSAYYDIVDASINQNKLHVQINYVDNDNQEAKYEFVFKYQGSSSYILEKVKNI